MTVHPASEVFELHRSDLFALAYRMIGERMAAEDVVQDAWLRWQAVGVEQALNPQAWLRTATTRLALDTLRKAKTRRESYIGPWLPEPIWEDPASDFAARLETAQEAELALLWAMEFLTPDERAAFILHDAFDESYAEIARVLERSDAACRKLVSRARRKTETAPMQIGARQDEVMTLLNQLMVASASGDIDAMVALLARDVVAITDGGGKRRAALRPLFGARETAQVLHAVARRKQAGVIPQWITINGVPALAVLGQGDLDYVTTLAPSRTEPGKIGWMYTLRNPDKMGGNS